MSMSEQVDQLFTALSQAQAEMPPAKRESMNPFFKSKYADLATIWEAVRPHITKYGLSICQVTTKEDVITTILGHKSGQWIDSSLLLNPAKPDPQSKGACISYYRRFQLSAIVGIATEDDDGQAASAPAPYVQRTAPAVAQQSAPLATQPAPARIHPDIPNVEPKPGSNADLGDSKVTKTEAPDPSAYFNSQALEHRKLVSVMLDHLYDKQAICSPDWRAKNSTELAKSLHGKVPVRELKDAIVKFYQISTGTVAM